MAAIWMLPSLVLGLYLGFSTGMWQLAMMSFGSALIALLVARSRRSNGVNSRPESQEFSVLGRLILFGGKRVGQFRWWMSRPLRSAAGRYLAELEQLRSVVAELEVALRPGFRSSAKGQLCAVLGVARGSPFEFDLGEAPHTFVIGPTGSGKSQFLRIVSKSLANRYLPSELELRLVDFKGANLFHGLGLEPWLGDSLSDLDDKADDFWLRLQSELTERERNELRLLRGESTGRFPRLVVIVDELAEVLRNPMAGQTLTSIAAKGRSLGVHLLVATQGLSGIPRDLLLNLRARVALSGVDQVELVQLGAKANQLHSPDSATVAARLIRHQHPEADFVFAVGLV
jgi:energy-coupling factor transporter ATP-binding protein EcfA2